jgi:putative membrane protein
MQDKNVPEPKNLAAEQHDVINSMSSLSGAEFDREFADKMVADHEKAVDMFREEQANAQNPDLKKYVNDVLPKLEMHLEKSSELQRKVSGPSSR